MDTAQLTIISYFNIVRLVMFCIIRLAKRREQYSTSFLRIGMPEVTFPGRPDVLWPS